MRKILSLLLASMLCLAACQKAEQPASTTQATDNDLSATSTSAPIDPPTTIPEADPDAIPAPEEGTEINLRYQVNSPLAGTLQGETQQTVYYGKTVASRVAAEANPGYRFVGWSDGSDNLIRNHDCPKTDTVYTAIFAYDPMELPMLHLTTDNGRDVVSKTRYIGGTITISNCDGEYALDKLDMEIRGRGNSSWDIMEKKSYRLRLSQKENLLGLGEGSAKSWVLLAVHADQALLRNHITMEYARKLGGMAFMPASTAVDLYLNGEYRGVYFLCEQIEVNRHRVNIAEEPESLYTGYFIEMSAYAKEPRFTVGDKRYEIKNDLSVTPELQKQQIHYIYTEIARCWNAVVWGDEKVVRLLIDVPSVVDAYIVEELTKNLDAGWDSFYLYRQSGGKLTFGPLWDFDMSSGNVTADKSSVCHLTFEKPQGLYPGNTMAGMDHQQNEWFQLLMKTDWFVELVKIRWQELSPKMAELPDLLLQTGSTYQAAFERNFQKWTIFTWRLTTEADVILTLDSYEKQLCYLADWYRDRIAWLDLEWGDGEDAEAVEPV